VHLDETAARELYLEAMKLSDTNPLVLRSYALFLLSTCEHPLKSTRDRALFFLRDAKIRDPDRLKFNTAYSICFKYGCYKNPNDYRSILNLGLATYFVYNDLELSEKMLRRAVSMAPFEPRIIENWKFLRDKFPEKKILFNPKSRVQNLNTSIGGKKVMMHGLLVQEDPAWAGWVYYAQQEIKRAATPKLEVKKSSSADEDEGDDLLEEEERAEKSKAEEKLVSADDEFLALNRPEPYWYNPATGEKSLDPPDFQEQWKIRMKRSKYEGLKDGLEHYYDPITSTYFQYHSLTDTFC
jgi:hypothetical protein